MIIDAALYPAMSRRGFDDERWPSLPQSLPAEIPTTVEGRWLTAINTAQRELGRATLHFLTYVASLEDKGVVASDITSETLHLLEGAAFNDETGCWVAEGPSADEHHEVLRTLATHERGRILNLDNTETTNELRICNDPSCLNTRHYDFTEGITTRQVLLEPDPNMYEVLASGRIKTRWGDILPSVQDSIAYFRQLQAKCLPYTNEAKSLLTAHGISQITINETTGCWAVRSYYSNARHQNGKDTDGYGRWSTRSYG